MRNIKKVNHRWLKNKKACINGMEYWRQIKLTETKKIIERCIIDQKMNYAIWLTVKALNQKHKNKLAKFAMSKVARFDNKGLPNYIEYFKIYLRTKNDDYLYECIQNCIARLAAFDCGNDYYKALNDFQCEILRCSIKLMR